MKITKSKFSCSYPVIIADERPLSRDGRYDDFLEMDESLHGASHRHHFNRSKGRYDTRDDQPLNRFVVPPN